MKIPTACRKCEGDNCDKKCRHYSGLKAYAEFLLVDHGQEDCHAACDGSCQKEVE